ncbi:DUF6609 family protein [Enterococcus sp. CWB-B31]|uniref:DUF6609 family protein n=1 Tax=Enterococcus sp. CWB-B31 TaxID=2885159 RepID=UPI003B6384FD
MKHCCELQCLIIGIVIAVADFLCSEKNKWKYILIGFCGDYTSTINKAVVSRLSSGSLSKFQDE